MVVFFFFFLAWLDREKDEDEGIPSETEDDKRQLETKAKEMRGEGNAFGVFVRTKTGVHVVEKPHRVFLTIRLCRSDLLKQKDSEIISLLEEKIQLFRGMWEGFNPGEEMCRQVEPLFRSACSQELPRGASVMKDALQEGKKEKESVYSSPNVLPIYAVD